MPRSLLTALVLPFAVVVGVPAQEWTSWHGQSRDGVIYGHSIRNKGQFVALDPASGTSRWTTSGRTADHASLQVTPSHLVFMTSDGQLIVAGRSPTEFAVEKQYQVAAAATYATPVFLGGDLIVRDATSVRKLSGQ